MLILKRGDEDCIEDDGDNANMDMADNLDVASEEDPGEALGNEFAGLN